MNTRVPLVVALLFITASAFGAPPSPTVPGIVVNHIPAATGLYIGSPSLAVLADGRYVASHDHFGPKSQEHEKAITAIFRSADRGKSWEKISKVHGAFWSSLFVHRDALYLLGPDRHHGNILIRRSTDGGKNWTTPTDASTGLLRDNGEYHCAPMPVLEHNGRLWRAFEWRNPPVAWGINYRAGVLSAAVDADLLKAESWTSTNFVPSDRAWNGGDMGAWLEGNAVVSPDGQLVDVLRVQTRSPDEKAAVVRISADGRTASFDPETGFIDFPGGAKKFAIRFDPESKLYWSLASIVHPRHRAEQPGGIRNTLALTCSPDLVDWTVRCIVLYHPDTHRHGFQYVDWLVDGADLIALSRTAYDDGQGGAHNFHDANYLTFHRIENFRDKTMADSVPITELPMTALETGALVIRGRGWTQATLADDQKAFGNRAYVWKNVPPPFRDWHLTQTNGGDKADIRVTARRDTTLYVTSAQTLKTLDPAHWSVVPDAEFHYTDTGRTPMAIFRRDLRVGEEVILPQANWTGTAVLWPRSDEK